MALKSPRQNHGQWPNAVNPTQLPNVAGSPTQDVAVEVGDTCYSISDTTTYTCTTATVGAAVWSGGGGGGTNLTEYDFASGYAYSQQAVPVEETMGGGRLDGSQIQATAYFRATWEPQFGAAGNAYVRLYDLGPAAGPPVAPTLITTLTTAASGLRYNQQALAVGGAPGANQIMNTPRMYEVTVEQSSLAGDTVDVRSAGISDR